MTQQEKELLLKDLCAKLPYEVMIHHPDYDEPQCLDTLYTFSAWRDGGILCEVDDVGDDTHSLTDCKPYLRPMSSMTEEDKREFQSFFPGSFGAQWLNEGNMSIDVFECDRTMTLYVGDGVSMIDWLNAHHFDYRGLIEKGLALPAPDGMYV